MFSKKYLDVVSARFTSRSIFCEIATAERSMVAKISPILFCKIIIELICKINIVAKIPRVL